jgi:hypothetical protein
MPRHGRGPRVIRGQLQISLHGVRYFQEVGAGKTVIDATVEIKTMRPPVVPLRCLPIDAFGLLPFETGARPRVGAATIPNDILVSGFKRMQ